MGRFFYVIGIVDFLALKRRFPNQTVVYQTKSAVANQSHKGVI